MASLWTLGWSPVRLRLRLLLRLLLVFGMFLVHVDSPPVPDTKSWTGLDHELPCVVEMPKEAEVLFLEWTRQGSDGYVLMFRDGNKKTSNKRFIDRVRLRHQNLTFGDMTIIVKNISTEDTGLYTCMVIYEKEDQRPHSSPDMEADVDISEQHRTSRDIHLTVKAVEQVEAQSGQTVELPCEFPEGAPQVQDLQWTKEGSDGFVLWYKNGTEQEEKQNNMFKTRVKLQDLQLRSGNITVKDISAEDSGVYRCVAQSQISHQHHQLLQVLHLTVKTEPSAWTPALLISVILIILFVVVAVVLVVVALRNVKVAKYIHSWVGKANEKTRKRSNNNQQNPNEPKLSSEEVPLQPSSPGQS